MLGLVSKLLSKSKSRLSPNLWLKSSLNWPNRVMNFPNGSACLEGIYRSWRVRPRKELQLWNLIFRSPLFIDNGTRLNKYCFSNVNGFQNATTSRQFSDKPCVMDEKDIKDHLIMESIIKSYQTRGHLVAKIDPLGIIRGPDHKETVLANEVVRNLQILDLNKLFYIGENTFIGGGKKELPAHEIIKRLEEAYCKSIAVEYRYITDYDQSQFLKEKFETPGLRTINNNRKKLILKRLYAAQQFELFLGKKFPSEKRFGLEGGDILIPAMKHMIDIASEYGVEHFVTGMAHRGRLNVLANVAKYPLEEIFSLFRKVELGNSASGDVKYHLGVHINRINDQTNKPFSFSIVANPSHLECVNPLVIGKAYAHQFYYGNKDKVWPILIHGDAAMTGQGIVYETFHLSELPCYSTDGVIHIIINNQIGFTTDPRMSRSSEYCTAVGKVLDSPIIHVNGDDPEAVIFAVEVATEYKQKFKQTVVLDIVCYRRRGHNEADEPMFTQPHMYTKIKIMKPCFDLYAEKLINENVLQAEDIKSIKEEYDQILETAAKESESIKIVDIHRWIDSPWKGFFTKDKDPLHQPGTGVKKDILLKIGEIVSTPPPDFVIHRSLQRILNGRKKMIGDENIDYAIAEAFAFGSILLEGMTVRMTGQDCERGTFGHRHSVYHHQSKDRKTYIPLNNLSPSQGKFIICNSSLSEFGVLGFELGFNMVTPHHLVLWEAQFGDFVNTAQCIIDQFLASGEAKWGRQSGLVMLLPHGNEGAGPDHTSCRPERFLQMCADDEDVIELDMPKQLLNANWFIVNATTPANYFHVLRRQVKLNYRKPLVIFTPKSTLRDPNARSTIDELVEGTKFKPYLKDETIQDGGKVNKLLFCSGKIFYGLKHERDDRKLNETIAISRIEQLYPFPYADIIEDVKRYPNAKIFWVQEEHKNLGCWTYVNPRFHSAFPGKDPIKYFGRPASASTATGIYTNHLKEHKELMDNCFKT